MKRLIMLFALHASLSYGQAIQQDIDHLQSRIDSGDWKKAAELSRALKERVVDARNQALAKGGAGLVDSILAWLPQDTETLVVAQEPFTGKTAVPYVSALLGAAEKGQLLKQLENRTITLAALGARKFGEGGPTDNVPRLGLIPYEGCAVYRLSESPDGVLPARVPEEKLQGHPVWQSKATESDGPDWETIYVTMLDPQILLACNNHAFLREMISRKSAPRQPRALPASLREWSLVERNSPVWGISHYRNGVLAEALTEISDATGIAVNFGKTTITARMISKSDPWSKLIETPDLRGTPKARKAGNDVWELTLPGEGQSRDIGMLILMATMGFVALI